MLRWAGWDIYTCLRMLVYVQMNIVHETE